MIMFWVLLLSFLYRAQQIGEDTYVCFYKTTIQQKHAEAFDILVSNVKTYVVVSLLRTPYLVNKSCLRAMCSADCASKTTLDSARQTFAHCYQMKFALFSEFQNSKFKKNMIIVWHVLQKRQKQHSMGKYLSG